MQTYTVHSVHTQNMTESEFQELSKEGENYFPVNLYATQTQKCMLDSSHHQMCNLKIENTFVRRTLRNHQTN